MAFYKKRDHMQIIADILNVCKKPQTKTYIRRQTNISYEVLQNCILQLLVGQWLKIMQEDCGSKKLTITEKGTVFLEKYIELQKIAGSKNKQ